MNNCIVTLATQKNNYIKGMARLAESLRNNFDGDFLGFTSELSVGAPLHAENPYAFKIYAIEKALEIGYTKILWLDSSCFAIRNMQPVFEAIENDGFIFQDSGHWLGQWTNDRTLEYFGISRDEAMGIRMIGNAGFLGFDFENPNAAMFFANWKLAMMEGFFKGAWTNTDRSESEDDRCRGHRHDMSCSSAMVYKMGLTELMKGGEEWLQYAGPYYPTLNETIILKAEGL
jgi:hypothetical protein